MEEGAEGLRQQLRAARENVERHIDKLRARPYPAAAGPGGTALQGIGGLARTHGAMIDNDELNAKLPETLRAVQRCPARFRNQPYGPETLSFPPATRRASPTNSA